MLDRINRKLFSKYKAMKLLADSPIKILIIGVLGLSTVLIWWAIAYRIKATSSGIGITVNQAGITTNIVGITASQVGIRHIS